jgi:hypothetical protein
MFVLSICLQKTVGRMWPILWELGLRKGYLEEKWSKGGAIERKEYMKEGQKLGERKDWWRDGISEEREVERKDWLKEGLVTVLTGWRKWADERKYWVKEGLMRGKISRAKDWSEKSLNEGRPCDGLSEERVWEGGLSGGRTNDRADWVKGLMRGKIEWMRVRVEEKKGSRYESQIWGMLMEKEGWGQGGLGERAEGNEGQGNNRQSRGGAEGRRSLGEEELREKRIEGRKSSGEE